MNLYRENKKPYFCVATTTYNMGDTIRRTYASVLAQTYRRFYWLVIDNGSEDDTEQFIAACIQEKKIFIEYVKIPHGIRAVGINAMLDHMRGDLCVEVHADDTLQKDALEIFAREWLRIPDDRKKGIWTMAAHCIDNYGGQIVGKPFPEHINANPKRAWRYQFHTIGEKHYAMNVHIVKTRRIDIQAFTDIAYIGEDLLWIEFQREYLMWFINKSTRVYFDDHPNRASQVTLSASAREAYYQSHLRMLNTFFRFDRTPFREFIHHAALCFYHGYAGGHRCAEICQELYSVPSRLLLVASWPLLAVRAKLLLAAAGSPHKTVADSLCKTAADSLYKTATGCSPASAGSPHKTAAGCSPASAGSPHKTAAGSLHKAVAGSPRKSGSVKPHMKKRPISSSR